MYKDKNKAKYMSQKHMATIRNIEWQFTYESWLEWWGSDIVNRGRGQGKLCMARLGDTGPYHPNNVRKLTHQENSSEKVMPEDFKIRQSQRQKNIPKPESTRLKMADANKRNAKIRWHSIT